MSLNARFDPPELTNEKPIMYCPECGEDIYEGEEYYQLEDITICEDCISKFKKIAEAD